MSPGTWTWTSAGSPRHDPPCPRGELRPSPPPAHFRGEEPYAAAHAPLKHVGGLRCASTGLTTSCSPWPMSIAPSTSTVACSAWTRSPSGAAGGHRRSPPARSTCTKSATSSSPRPPHLPRKRRPLPDQRRSPRCSPRAPNPVWRLRRERARAAHGCHWPHHERVLPRPRRKPCRDQQLRTARRSNSAPLSDPAAER